MKKVKVSTLLKAAFKKAANPVHLRRAIQLQRSRKKLVRAAQDPQLLLYAQIMPGGFLHYGYFDDPTLNPRDMTLNDISAAQHKYAELVLEKVTDTDSPILDVGCGMGGLVRLMLERGWNPVALSPDVNQIRAVQAAHPHAPTVHAKFEDIPVAEHQNRYGTIINAESLNYLHLEASIPLIEQLLKPNGRWVICDFFRMDETGDTSGHWEFFKKSVEDAGFHFVFQRDITPHILPTIAYVHMWGAQIGLPMIDFSIEKLHVKAPGFHYLLKETLDAVLKQMKRHLETVDPADFSKRKKYMLMVVERAPKTATLKQNTDLAQQDTLAASL